MVGRGWAGCAGHVQEGAEGVQGAGEGVQGDNEAACIPHTASFPTGQYARSYCPVFIGSSPRQVPPCDIDKAACIPHAVSFPFFFCRQGSVHLTCCPVFVVPERQPPVREIKPGPPGEHPPPSSPSPALTSACERQWSKPANATCRERQPPACMHRTNEHPPSVPVTDTNEHPRTPSVKNDKRQC
jgi:hypothetical protein